MGSAAAQYVHTAGQEIVDGNGKPLHLHGLNLGNWMVTEGYMWKFDPGPASEREIEEFTVELLGPTQAEAFWKQYRDTYYTADDMRRIRAMGFDSVRIPLHARFFAPGDDAGFVTLDRLVNWCRDAGLLVVLDLHAAPGNQTGANMDDSHGWPWLYTDAKMQAQAEDLWRRIAQRYHDNTTVIGYDLLNEPLPDWPAYRQFDKELEPLYKRFTAAVRAQDPNHAIIVGGAEWDTKFSVFGEPWDKNLIYEVHRYQVPPTQASLQQYLDFRAKHNVPLWLGEFGENDDTWTAAFVQLAEKNNIGWCFWPYKKMAAPSSPVTFPEPPFWDEIIAYAKLSPNSARIEPRIKVRPPQEHIDAAFAGMLRNIQYSQETLNAANLRALLPKSAARHRP